jgi:hypothetical protein
MDETDTEKQKKTRTHTTTTCFLVQFMIQRDYFAAESMIETIASDAKVHSKRDRGDFLYSLFLDDPTTGMMSGTHLRFACGILVDKKGQDKKQTLLEMNKEIRKLQTPEDADLGVLKLWKRLTYETTSLPSVDAAVVHFPFTNGIVSALVLSYKVSLCGQDARFLHYM